ncbi:MAG: hypothetical protein Ct9H300mP29_6990 [Candidatus Neomarinimicrobiota bacterium]|nr:MAG: hypothetical protein Ct9H300mP29_6990 [Candidatus Neomarinimicrobiota bacterium]
MGIGCSVIVKRGCMNRIFYSKGFWGLDFFILNNIFYNLEFKNLVISEIFN